MPATPHKTAASSKILRIALWLTAITAALMLALALYIWRLDAEATPLTEPLTEIVPAQFGNWTSKEVPLSESEEMRSRVSTILKYDDVLSRVYDGAGLRLSLYAGYWNPGKLPVSEVTSHTPDSCWVAGGWECTQRESEVNVSVRGHALKPFEYGAYRKDGHTEYVIFWHLVGDGTNHMRYVGWRNGLIGRIERLPLLFKSFEKFGLNQRREQFFIRLSSPTPFNELWQNPQFLDFIEHMKPLRIFESAPTP